MFSGAIEVVAYLRNQEPGVDERSEWVGLKERLLHGGDRSGGNWAGDEDAVAGACRHDPPLGAAMAEAVAKGG